MLSAFSPLLYTLSPRASRRAQRRVSLHGGDAVQRGCKRARGMMMGYVVSVAAAGESQNLLVYYILLPMTNCINMKEAGTSLKLPVDF